MRYPVKSFTQIILKKINNYLNLLYFFFKKVMNFYHIILLELPKIYVLINFTTNFLLLIKLSHISKVKWKIV